MQDPAVSYTEGSHWIEITWTLVATAGGIAKYFNERIKYGQPFSIAELLIKAFISGFTGWSAAHAARLVYENGDFVILAAAVGGWLGGEVMDWIIRILKRKLPPAAQA